MNKLWKTSFSTDLEEYELSIGWDNEAFIDGAVSFTILVEKRDLESGEVIYDRGVQISIDEDENNEPVLRLVCGEDTLLEYPLEQLSEVDELIEMIPAWVFTAGIDPMMGCLLRSGISTSVSQIIKIKQETDGASWFLERTAAIGRSLLNSFPEMCGTMTRRAFRCAVKFGF